MASIGQQLTSPESGWKRYDDMNSNISYGGTGWSSGTSNEWYLTTYHQNNTINSSIKFNFTKSKIRIIATVANVGSTNIQIKIDNNITETYSLYQTNRADQVLVYEKTGLLDREHYVEIKLLGSGYLFLDAIDIDSNGELKLYNLLKFNKFLIKQNSNYYTINSNNYDSTTTHSFTSLNLTGGVNPNKNDIDTFGFEDINLLTNSMIVNTDTFIPVLKFDNTAELKLYKG